MSHTHGSIERLKQALMMLCTHLIYGICSGENGIYWMERGGEKSQHNCVSQREAMLEQFWPTLERVIITDRNWWCLFRFQLIRSLGYWCTTYCLSQRKRRPNSRNFPPARDEVSRFAIPIHIGNAADQQANLWSLIGRSDECDHDRSGRDRDRGRFQRGNGWPPLRRPWSPRRPCRTPTGAGQKIWQCWPTPECVRERGRRSNIRFSRNDESPIELPSLHTNSPFHPLHSA